MIAIEDTVLVLLAAGRSSRFGDRNKLEAPFLGKPVGLHVATTLSAMPFLKRFVVVNDCQLDFGRHFEPIANDRVDLGMAQSVRLGVEQARALDAQAVAIALADMPRVTAAHIYRLLDAADSADAVVVSSDGVQPSPPGVFGRERFDALMALKGDQGARDMVLAGRHVVTSPAELIDIDTPEDLERLCELVHSPAAITRAAARRSD